MLLPYVPTATAIKQHPLHHHIFTFLTGDEQDITDAIPLPPDSRASQRQRTAAEASATNTDSRRNFSTAPWLDQGNEMGYKAMALKALSEKGLGSGFDMGRLKGSQFYCTTTGTSRRCLHGGTHDRNNFYVEFERSGRITYHCHSSRCTALKEVLLGQWCPTIEGMLSNVEMWQPGSELDAALLKGAFALARKAMSKGDKLIDMDFYPDMEETICRYISHFIVFVSTPSVYVVQTRDSDGDVATYHRYDGNKLKNVVKPFEQAFKLWDSSHLRQSMGTKVKFVGNPWDNRVSPNEYNLCSNMMPLLKTERRTLTDADLLELEPILAHIRDVLCAGVSEDFNNLMAWLAHVVQDPAEKTGWCPVIISDQGTGKGVS